MISNNDGIKWMVELKKQQQEKNNKKTSLKTFTMVNHGCFCRASAQGILGHGPGRWQGRGRQDVEIREVHEVSARRIHLTDAKN